MKIIATCAVLMFALASCAAPAAQPSVSPGPGAVASASPSPTAAVVAWVVYFARDLATPVAVRLEGPAPGTGVELRLRQRMDLLAGGPRSRDGGAFNVLPTMKAHLAAVTVAADLATLDYSVPEDDWGLNGSATLRAFVQQVVYTASEEAGIVRVLITQNAGRQAVIGGEGLVIGGAQTRAGLGYEGLMPNQAARVIRMSVTGARPLLIPNGIPDGWTAAIRADANTFAVTYTDPTGAKTVTLAIAPANPPSPDSASSQVAPSFHGDPASRYQIRVASDPRSERWLTWTEAGSWSLPGSRGVPYILSSAGLTDVEFWRLAESLHPDQT